jgi:aliphatic nitrilase
MGDQPKRFRAAAVQASSVGIDREETTEKACQLIQEAGENGAELIAFPEAFIPTYPYWVWLGSPPWGVKFFRQLYLNAVEVPSETTRRLGEAARRAQAYVAIGINERVGHTLYNSILYLDRRGEVLGVHRKLRPTFAEKLVWGEGDGSHLTTYETDLGRLGGLICGEHMMDLARYALYTMGEEIHLALWPGISSLRHVGRSATFNSFSEAACVHHAVAGAVFVLAAYSVVGEELIEIMGLAGQPELVAVGGGHTAIIAPNGQVLSGPLEDKEGIVYADLDTAMAIPNRQVMDPVGHYARPDVLRLLFNRSRQASAEQTGERGGIFP